MNLEPLRHPPLRILIGPPIDDWFHSEIWALRGAERRRSTLMDMAQSQHRSESNIRRSRTLGSVFENNNQLQVPNANVSVHNETRSCVSYNLSSASNRNPSLSCTLEESSNFPRRCRALVRLELARDWHGPAGAYRLDQIESVERKFSPFQEYGLVLYHNRLELTESQDQVDVTIRFGTNVKLSLYSSIDNSLALSLEHPGELNTQVYILVFPTTFLARSWYLSFHRVMGTGKAIPEQITVAVPELDTQVQVLITSDLMTVWELRDAVLTGLSGEASWEGTLQRWREEQTAGVCWKHFDKLEWVSERQSSKRNSDLVVTPQLIEGTHELQIRTIDHSLGVPESAQPLAIEGYAVFKSYSINSEDAPQILSSGRLKKDRAYYISTFQHHIIYVDAFKFSKKLKGSKPPIECIPYTFIESCNRPGFDDHHSHQANRVSKKDPNTHSDLNLWRNADGFFDVQEMVSVSAKGVLAWEIELYGGSVLKFEAWDASTRAEWVRRLQQLLAHWRPLLLSEARQLVNYAKLNTSKLGEDGHPETGVNFEAANRRVLANPLLWRICQVDRCSPVLHSGVLFLKDHPHMAFKKVHVILTLDAIHLFEASVATHYSEDEVSVPIELTSLPNPLKMLHSRLSMFGANPLPLQNCFTYAHYAFDLVDEVDSPPRVFPDLLVACDREPDRTFGIWSSNLSYLWPGHQEASWWSQMSASLYRSLACGHAWYWPWRLGRPHGSHSRLICQARTRLERDHWVHVISIAIDYFVINRQWDKSL